MSHGGGPALGGLWAFARFEVRRCVRTPSTWIYLGVLGALGLLIMLTIGGFFTSVSIAAIMHVAANSPLNIASDTFLLGLLALPIVAAIAGNAVHQDVAHRCEGLVFTAPVRPAAYLIGRWLAASTVSAAVLAAIPVGLWLGTLMPGMDPAVLGPNRLVAYAQPFAVLLLPNVLVLSAVFVTLAALTRGMAWVHAGAVILLVGYLISGTFAGDVHTRSWSALLDPFGGHAMHGTTRSWSQHEQNTRLMPITGWLLANRALWLGIGAAVFAGCLLRFRFANRRERMRAAVPTPPAPVAAEIPRVATTAPRGLAAVAVAMRLSWLWFRGTISRTSFIVLLLAGALTLLMVARSADLIYGTGVYPVTSRMTAVVAGGMALFAWTLILVCAGELAWRERDEGFDQLVDTLPMPHWVPALGKLGALVLVQALVVAVSIVCGMAIQLGKGYTALEPLLYLQALGGFWLWHLALGAALALAVQILIGSKHVAWFVVAVYLIGRNWLDDLGFEHPLYRYGVALPPHSDLNGFAGFVAPAVWQGLYSTAWALLLLLLAILCWPRGVERGPRARWRRVRERLTRPAIAGIAAAALAILATGAVIHQRTGVAVPFRTQWQNQQLQAEYERRYRTLADEPQPRIAAVTAAIDLFPSERRMRAHGSYRLLNRTAQPIASVIVRVPESAIITRLTVDGVEEPVEVERTLGFRRYRLARPMPVGGEATLAFDLARGARLRPGHRAGRQRLLHHQRSAAPSRVRPRRRDR